MKKHRKKNTLRELAKHIGLKVKFVTYLPDAAHGKLFPREKRILINAHKPRNEHIYTLLHEIGHFVTHFKNPTRKFHHRFFDLNWKAEWLAKICAQFRRSLRYFFNKESGKEWQADAWAMAAFVILAKRFGFRDELRIFLKRHPEKVNFFRLLKVCSIYCDLKTSFKKAYQAARA
jgi:IrrE N-terminal-like domain